MKTSRVVRTRKVPSVSEYPATYILVTINIVIFLVMFLRGPGMLLFHGTGLHSTNGTFESHAQFGSLWNAINAPFDETLIYRFGGSDSVSVLHGQWWRLVTSTFVHVTVLHLLMNMWCLWNLGFFGEPLLGKPGLISVYLLTGTAGMLSSLAWGTLMRRPGIVAGASGAVFGIAGILIVLLSNRELNVPWQELVSLRRSVILFAVLNLAVGVVPLLLPGVPVGWYAWTHIDLTSLPQVDNTAHLGGFLSGIALGLPLFPRMVQGKASYRARQNLVFVCATLLLCIFAYGVAVFSRAS